jgi:hypothetical protein
MSWTLHGMAADGSSWGYTDDLGQTWWASTQFSPRAAQLDALLRYGAYGGWDMTRIEFEGPDGIVGTPARQNGSEGL